MHQKKIESCFLILISLLVCYTAFSQNNTYKERKEKQLAGPSPFQRELDGLLPKNIVYQDSLVMALDGNPTLHQLPVHILIIPKRRIPTANDLTENDEKLVGHMIYVAKNLAKQKGIDETGYRLTMNTNEDAGQSAFHLHLHLLGGAKTGAMVEQGWRAIQRALRAATDTIYKTITTTDPLLVALMGSWQSKDSIDKKSLVTTMQWEPTLQFQFMKMSMKEDLLDEQARAVQSMEATAHLRPNPTQKNAYQASWSDSKGNTLIQSAFATGSTTLTVQILTNTGEQKIQYHLTDPNHIEMTTFIKQMDNWNTIKKQQFTRIF